MDLSRTRKLFDQCCGERQEKKKEEPQEWSDELIPIPVQEQRENTLADFSRRTIFPLPKEHKPIARSPSNTPEKPSKPVRNQDQTSYQPPLPSTQSSTVQEFKNKVVNIKSGAFPKLLSRYFDLSKITGDKYDYKTFYRQHHHIMIHEYNRREDIDYLGQIEHRHKLPERLFYYNKRQTIQFAMKMTLRKTQKLLKSMRMPYMDVVWIPGKGNRSENQLPVLNPLMVDFLKLRVGKSLYYKGNPDKKNDRFGSYIVRIYSKK